MRKRVRGFTLLELVLVVAGVSLIAVLAVPTFVNSINKAQLEKELEVVESMRVAVNLYYNHNGHYPTDQYESEGQKVPIEGNPHTINLASLVPKYMLEEPKAGYWWVDYAGLVYYTPVPLGGLVGNVFTPQEGNTYYLNGESEAITGAVTLGFTDYLTGFDSKGRVLPKLKLVFDAPDEPDEPEEPEAPSVPMFMAMSTLSGGQYTTYKVSSDATLDAWGLNSSGQAGVDDASGVLSKPKKVKDLKDVKQVSAGAVHTLALRKDDSVVAWGYNADGQLGDGTYKFKKKPVVVKGVVGAKVLFAGTYHNFAVLHDGTVKAWGDNTYGQLGDGTTKTRLTAVTVPGLVGVVQLALGYDHSVALLSNGSVKVWGDNYYGVLGDGTNEGKSTPKELTGLGVVVRQVASGAYHTVALLSDGTVKSWGYNLQGQLGDGSTINKNAPVTVYGLSGVKQVVAGTSHSLALMADGTVKAWGKNTYGQLGDGTTKSRYTPVTVVGLSKVKELVACGFHSYAIMEDGTVKAWGMNYYSQLGDGTRTDRLTPVLVKLPK